MVAHLQHQVPPWVQFGRAGRQRLPRWQRQFQPVQQQLDAPLALHGIGRVDEQVHQHLLQLGGVGHDFIVVDPVFHPQLTLAREARSHHLARLLDEVGEVHLLQFGRRLPAKGEQLTHQPVGVAGGLQGLLQRLVAGVFGVQVFGGQTDPAGDGRQRIVEIVRDATGQPTERLGLLALHQLHLQRLMAFMRLALGLGIALHPLQQPVDALPQRAQFVISGHLQAVRRRGAAFRDALHVPVQTLQAAQQQAVEQHDQQQTGQQARQGGQGHAGQAQGLRSLEQLAVQAEHQFGHGPALLVLQHGVQILVFVVHRRQVRQLTRVAGVVERQAHRHHQQLAETLQFGLVKMAQHQDGAVGGLVRPVGIADGRCGHQVQMAVLDPVGMQQGAPTRVGEHRGHQFTQLPDTLGRHRGEFRRWPRGQTEAGQGVALGIDDQHLGNPQVAHVAGVEVVVHEAGFASLGKSHGIDPLGIVAHRGAQTLDLLAQQAAGPIAFTRGALTLQLGKRIAHQPAHAEHGGQGAEADGDEHQCPGLVL